MDWSSRQILELRNRFFPPDAEEVAQRQLEQDVRSLGASLLTPETAQLARANAEWRGRFAPASANRTTTGSHSVHSPSSHGQDVAGSSSAFSWWSRDHASDRADDPLHSGGGGGGGGGDTAVADIFYDIPVSQKDINDLLDMEVTVGGANLSGGFAQSVALARIFLRASEAQIIILDEAMGQMDAIKKREYIMPRVFEFVREHGMTLIVISHDVLSVCQHVDYIYVLHNGRLAHQGSHDQLVAAQATHYLRLIGAQPAAGGGVSFSNLYYPASNGSDAGDDRD